MINSRNILFIVAFSLIFLMGHAPWGQHHVYRQIHMLIMCSKKDYGAFEFTKHIAKYFQEYLPNSKARVARAPHKERIFALLKSNQIPLALFSYTQLNKIKDYNAEYSSFLSENTKVLFFFPSMVLISNREFSLKKSERIFQSLKKAQNYKKFNNIKFKNRNNYFIPFFKATDN